jgi:O-antigen/teichoic acid export membrane protein
MHSSYYSSIPTDGKLDASMSQRAIFLFWLPLFASWLLMTLEGPIVSATINRLPNEVVMLAAQGIVVSISVTIESPIINLLATSTALSKDRASYLLLRKFTFHWMIFLTAITILLAFTPLFELVFIKLMAIPEEITAWIRPGLRIMTFWSAAIAWRRFLQGIMIRYNQTRKVAWGTLVRLISSAGTVIILASSTDWAGVIIGSIALMAGVISEALYATLAVQPILNNQLKPHSKPAELPALTYSTLFWFHLPLAATSLLILLVQPLVALSLARSPNPILSLAAWPVVFQIMLVMRAAAFALPEVVIALTKGEETFKPLRRFSLSLVLGTSIFMCLFVLTPLVDFYLYGIQDTTKLVGTIASKSLLLFIPLPALTVMISWIRGLLINRSVTKAVNAGMVVNLVVTIILLVIGVRQQWPGINAAAIALVAAAFVEFLFLWWRVSDNLEFKFSIIEPRRRAVPG